MRKVCEQAAKAERTGWHAMRKVRAETVADPNGRGVKPWAS